MHDPAPDATPSTGTPRAVKLTLFASLALNLLIVGLIAGTWISEGPPRRDPGPAGFAYIRALDAGDRQAIGAQMRDRRPRGAGTGEAHQALRLLRTDPFDAAGFDAFLTRQAQRGQAVREVGQGALVARIAGMDAAARAAYADRLEAVFGKSKRR
ncbi:periplasmic heavy metal sensor [Roseivivax sp. CAU 1753]